MPCGARGRVDRHSALVTGQAFRRIGSGGGADDQGLPVPRGANPLQGVSRSIDAGETAVASHGLLRVRARSGCFVQRGGSSSRDLPPSSPRTMWRAILVFSLFVIGFVGGAAIAGSTAPPGDGLSGGPRALIGGVAGAVLLPAAGQFALRRAGADLRRVASIVAALAAMAAAWVLMRLVM